MVAFTESESPIQVLHLMGSPTSTFYFDLSVMYGRTCLENAELDKQNFVHKAVVVYENGTWGFPSKVDEAGVKEARASAVSFGTAMERISAMSPSIDVVVPHMFCVEGLTRYRALAEMLNIELLGCSGDVCAVAQDKFITKAVCEVAGVPVPKGELLRSDVHGVDVGDTAKKLLDRQSIPFIVKPAKEDNSFGLSLVRRASVEEVSAALTLAFEYDEHVLVEEYIPGREVRVAVLEVEDGEGLRLEVLPKLEYILEDVREQKHKLGTDASGKLLTGDANISEAFAVAKAEGERICPAQLEPHVHARIDDLAKNAHKALGCKYYSLFDVRINPEGFPFMLEACLFCSFSPHSVVVSLASKATSSEMAALHSHPNLFESFLRRAARETKTKRTAQTDAHAAAPAGALKRRRVVYTN